MSKDGMSRDDMSPMHVTLKAGVSHRAIGEIRLTNEKERGKKI